MELVLVCGTLDRNQQICTYLNKPVGTQISENTVVFYMVSDPDTEDTDMALSGLKPPGPLSLSDNLSANWQSWFHAYEIYSTAAGIASKPEKVQCCVFLHVAGPEAQKIHRSMTFTAGECDKLTPLIEAFHHYCQGKTNTIQVHLLQSSQ